MKLAHIAPRDCTPLFLGERETYHMALVSQVLRSAVYASYYARARLRGAFVILDNDAYENVDTASSPIAAIREAAEKIHPSMIVLPDVMVGSCEENVEMAETAAWELRHLGIPYMAVPHSNTSTRAYVQCGLRMDQIRGVQALGIYKHLSRDHKMNRLEAVSAFSELRVGLHLLGVTNNLDELTHPYMRWRCMGADTVRFIQMGLRCQHAVPWYMPTYEGRQEDYFDIPAPERHDPRLDVVLSNIAVWRDQCTGL